MSHAFFITGTDTDVGKTFISAALLMRAGAQGYATVAYKPVAAGAELTADGLRNIDALTLMSAMNQPLAYSQVNPVCLQAAIAPHIAAEEEGESLSVAGLAATIRPEEGGNCFTLVEGAGGWRVPLNRTETLADLAVTLGYPVIMVVAMRLGCISHALLTAEAIARDGLELAGWVANTPLPEPMSRYRENLDTLKALLNAPLLGEVAYQGCGLGPSATAALKLPAGLERGV